MAHEICMLRSLGKATSDIGVCLSQGIMMHNIISLTVGQVCLFCAGQKILVTIAVLKRPLLFN